MDERRLRPIFLLEECNAKVISTNEMRDVDPELLSLRNVNTPDEYQAALKLADLVPNDDDGVQQR